MASLLRQIVAGPRARHPEAGLDLCYVTDDIIATSGPSQTYPQRAYRNPLDQLVKFLDSKHAANWAIWEFRGEGTGYPDELVYNRVRHYPWPDHHPPPFKLVPLIVASMRNWTNGNDLHADDAEGHETGDTYGNTDTSSASSVGPNRRNSIVGKVLDTWKDSEKKKNNRVVVVHCKAGKGRSGTMACSFLIAERGWTPEQALARFTERRMRPRMGAGVSIPSQLRTIAYVERWSRHGKKFIDRPVEILEIHVWGLRNGVKVGVEGFVEEGRKIKTFHTFTRKERQVVEGDPPGGNGVVDMIYNMAGYNTNSVPEQQLTAQEQQEVLDDARDTKTTTDPSSQAPDAPSSGQSTKSKFNKRTSTLIRSISTRSSRSTKDHSSAQSSPKPGNSRKGSTSSLNEAESNPEPGGKAVIFKPETPIRIPNSDVNITVERRNRAPSSIGLTVVTAFAHVWFNAFFEGNGPEQDGYPDTEGVFSIDWDKMDGVKGSSQKGTRAADRIAVVWRAIVPDEDAAVGERTAERQGEAANDPEQPSSIPQMQPANWKGGNEEDPGMDKGLGLRVRSSDSADISQASSVKGELAKELEIKEEEVEDALKGVKSNLSGDGEGKAADKHGDERLEAYAEKLPKPEGSETKVSAHDKE